MRLGQERNRHITKIWAQQCIKPVRFSKLLFLPTLPLHIAKTKTLVLHYRPVAC